MYCRMLSSDHIYFHGLEFSPPRRRRWPPAGKACAEPAAARCSLDAARSGGGDLLRGWQLSGARPRVASTLVAETFLGARRVGGRTVTVHAVAVVALMRSRSGISRAAAH